MASYNGTMIWRSLRSILRLVLLVLISSRALSIESRRLVENLPLLIYIKIHDRLEAHLLGFHTQLISFADKNSVEFTTVPKECFE